MTLSGTVEEVTNSPLYRGTTLLEGPVLGDLANDYVLGSEVRGTKVPQMDVTRLDSKNHSMDLYAPMVLMRIVILALRSWSRARK